MKPIEENLAIGCTFANGDVPSLGCLAPIVVNVINVAFMFLGFAALVLILYGAIRYVLSRGDQKGLQEAQKTITFAILGTILVLGSYILISLVFSTLGLPNILSSFSFYQAK